MLYDFLLSARKIIEIPVGGHVEPNPIVGDNLWKNAQNNGIKKNTSEIMNRIIPQRNPFFTLFVCSP
jgi:hypothetical protein